MKEWQLQEAKAKFSEVVRHAKTEGPQMITVHGEHSVIILSREMYEKLTKPKLSLVAFMQKSPLRGVQLNVDRDKSANRDISL